MGVKERVLPRHARYTSACNYDTISRFVEVLPFTSIRESKMSKLLTLGQSVAALNRVYSRESIRQRLADGRLTGFRVGGPTGKWVIPESELEKLVQPGVSAPDGQ